MPRGSFLKNMTEDERKKIFAQWKEERGGEINEIVIDKDVYIKYIENNWQIFRKGKREDGYFSDVYSVLKNLFFKKAHKSEDLKECLKNMENFLKELRIIADDITKKIDARPNIN